MTQTGKQIMYYIIDNTNQAVHREPNKKSYASTIVAVADYVEPMITKTGMCPGTGKEITVTEGINMPYYLSPLSESYWSR